MRKLFILLSAVLLIASGGMAQSIYVPADYATIQAALDAANDGDSIKVSEGTYTGALVILNDNITLTSTGLAENTIIDAENAINGIRIGEHNHPGIHPDGVVIDGFKVINWAERGISQRNGNGTMQLLNNILEGPVIGARNGINVSGGNGTLIQGNTITTSSFNQQDWSGTGILLMGTLNAVVQDNYIDGADLGIAIVGAPIWSNLDPNWVSASGNQILQNEVTACTSGISINGDASNTLVDNNNIHGNDRGVNEYPDLGGVPSGSQVVNNTIENNDWGIRIASSLSGDPLYDPVMSISGNDFVGNAPFHLRDFTNSMVETSLLANNTFDKGAYFDAQVGQLSSSIQVLIDASGPGDVIHVLPGTYDENLIVSEGITLNGANADVSCDSRGSESVIAPSSGLPISVTADGVTINGFEITAPAYQNAIVCGNTSDLNILFNNIHDIGNAVNGQHVHSIQYTVANASNTEDVTVSDNCFNNIGNQTNHQRSTSAIGFLQSTSTGVLSNLSIERNSINNINAKTADWDDGGRIAYGIQINTGGSGSYLTTGKVVDAVISQNEITNLEGFISTGIGLEGNTENVIVENNYVANLAGNKVGTRSGGGYDLQALKFENNRYVGTATVQNNSFEAGTFTHSNLNGVGYAVANYVPVGGSYSGGTTAALELGCNWYGTAVFTEIEDNALLTGRILNKEDCETTFVPYLVDGTDNELGTIGFQPVPNSCEGYPEGTVFVLDSNGEIIDFFFGNGAIAAAIASAVDGETVLISSGDYNEPLDASGMPDPSLTISIGESPGCVTVTGLTLTSNDTWLQEIEDYDPCTGYDQLTVNGNVDLGGATLDAQLLGGFVPAPGWEFEIIEYSGTLTGQFAEGTSIIIDGQNFGIDYGTGSNSVVTLIPQGYANYVWYDDQGNALNDGMTIDIDVEACQEVTVVVKLETEGPITTTDLKLNFDPNHLQVISIDGLAIFDEDDAIAGDLFGVGSPSYNNTSGEIYYATTSIGVFNSNSVSVSANYMTITFRAERNDSDNGDGTLTADNTTYTTSIEAVDIGVLGGTRIMNNFGFVPGGFEPLVTNVMLDAETLDVDITPDITDPVINGNGICLSFDDARFINVPGESLYQVDGDEFDVITLATDDCTTPTITHNASSIGGADGTGASDAASLDGWQLPVGTHTITFTASDGFNTVPCEVEITVEHQTLTGSAIINMGCNVGAPVRIRVYDGMTQVGTDFTTTLIAGGDFAAPIELIGVPAGTYTVIAEIDRYLAKGFTVNMTSSSAQPNIVLTQVIPGDIAGDTAPYNDNVINGVDLSLVISNYNTISSQSGFNNRPDLNCDNQVDAIDLSFVSFYYFTQGASPQ